MNLSNQKPVHSDALDMSVFIGYNTGLKAIKKDLKRERDPQ